MALERVTTRSVLSRVDPAPTLPPPCADSTHTDLAALNIVALGVLPALDSGTKASPHCRGWPQRALNSQAHGGTSCRSAGVSARELSAGNP